VPRESHRILRQDAAVGRQVPIATGDSLRRAEPSEDIYGPKQEPHLPSDIACADEARANATMTKPVDFKTFADDIRRFIEFWFGLAKLPLASTKS
jgi:hypothetical protein